MGTSMSLRWQLDQCECEFKIDGGVGTLSVRQGRDLVAAEPAASAQHAYDRSAVLARAARSPGTHAERTGT
jgi:hypothetical protein